MGEALLLGGPKHATRMMLPPGEYGGVIRVAVAPPISWVNANAADGMIVSFEDLMYLRRRYVIPIQQDGWDALPDSLDVRDDAERLHWHQRHVWATDAYHQLIDAQFDRVNVAVHDVHPVSGWLMYQIYKKTKTHHHLTWSQWFCINEQLSILAQLLDAEGVWAKAAA